MINTFNHLGSTVQYVLTLSRDNKYILSAIRDYGLYIYKIEIIESPKNINIEKISELVTLGG